MDKLRDGWSYFNIGGTPQAFSSYDMAKNVSEQLREKGYESNVVDAKQKEYAQRGYYAVIKRKR